MVYDGFLKKFTAALSGFTGPKVDLPVQDVHHPVSDLKPKIGQMGLKGPLGAQNVERRAFNWAK